MNRLSHFKYLYNINDIIWILTWISGFLLQSVVLTRVVSTIYSCGQHEGRSREANWRFLQDSPHRRWTVRRSCSASKDLSVHYNSPLGTKLLLKAIYNALSTDWILGFCCLRYIGLLLWEPKRTYGPCKIKGAKELV